jgi:glycerol-3-phosphate dehydrogenase
MGAKPVPLSRDLRRLAQTEYDVLVIGGGITGACVAWDAASRGVRVALVERGDFGGATSANSLKTVHGGLRYLRDGNLALVRRMAEERRSLLRIAPHLVHPLPVLMPTFEDHPQRSRWVLGAAAKLNDLLSFDRNRGLSQHQALPGSRLLSGAACLRILPGLDATYLSGAIVWHDAQVYNTERLTLAFLLSAANAGAQIANYAAVTGLQRLGQRVTGANVRDELMGGSFTVRARVIVNAAGPWVDEILHGVGEPTPPRRFHRSLAVNLVTRKLLGDYAVGLPSVYADSRPDGTRRRRAQVLFITPWRDYSLVGTRHTASGDDAAEASITEAAIRSLLEQANQAYPPLKLEREDVHLVHAGYLPAVPDSDDHAGVQLTRDSQVYDHAREDGFEGLVTVVGVKYTSARATAERTVDVVFRKLRRPTPSCSTSYLPLYGGVPLADAANSENAMSAIRRSVPEASLRALHFNHGSQSHEVLRYVEADGTWGWPVADDATALRAEVVYAVHAEMACKLTDAVVRRTELGSAGLPSEQAVAACAEIMAAELDWDTRRVQREIDDVWAYFAARKASRPVLERA